MVEPADVPDSADGAPGFWFNDLLRSAGLEPANTKLLRHRETLRDRDARLRHAALTLDPFFLRYQETQETPKFQAATHVASFVTGPASGAVFVGAWAVHGAVCETFPHAFEPERLIEGERYHLEHVAELDKYRGRLIVDWGPGTRNWVHWASRNPKRVLALLPAAEPLFPGWSQFFRNLADVPALPISWQAVLRHARGVYLITHRQSGAQYVGAAYGADGFLGRWLAYADGHAGNSALRELAAPPEEYDVSTLWVASSRDTAQDILAQEDFEKRRLGSRVHGLNRN